MFNNLSVLIKCKKTIYYRQSLYNPFTKHQKGVISLLYFINFVLILNNAIFITNRAEHDYFIPLFVTHLFVNSLLWLLIPIANNYGYYKDIGNGVKLYPISRVQKRIIELSSTFFNPFSYYTLIITTVAFFPLYSYFPLSKALGCFILYLGFILILLLLIDSLLLLVKKVFPSNNIISQTVKLIPFIIFQSSVRVYIKESIAYLNFFNKEFSVLTIHNKIIKLLEAVSQYKIIIIGLIIFTTLSILSIYLDDLNLNFLFRKKRFKIESILLGKIYKIKLLIKYKQYLSIPIVTLILCLYLKRVDAKPILFFILGNIVIFSTHKIIFSSITGVKSYRRFFRFPLHIKDLLTKINISYSVYLSISLLPIYTFLIIIGSIDYLAIMALIAFFAGFKFIILGNYTSIYFPDKYEENSIGSWLSFAVILIINIIYFKIVSENIASFIVLISIISLPLLIIYLKNREKSYTYYHSNIHKYL